MRLCFSAVVVKVLERNMFGRLWFPIGVDVHVLMHGDPGPEMLSEEGGSPFGTWVAERSEQTDVEQLLDLLVW